MISKLKSKLMNLNFRKVLFSDFNFKKKLKVKRCQIVFVGCSGYGNIGDDTYTKVLQKYLLETEYDITFKNSDPPRNVSIHCNVLVIGPGGIIFDDNSSHFLYMSEYLEDAISKNIPIIFLSCGVQSLNLTRWKKYLDIAKLITVRSKKDKEYLESFSDNPNIHYAPDLCYLFDEYENYPDLPSEYVLFIPTHSGGKSKFTSTFLHTSPEKRVLLRMGSMQDTEWRYKTWTDIGSAKVIMDVSPQTALYVVSKAAKVYTGRYHGLIFSRITGKEYETEGERLLKLNNEDRFSDMSQAYKHIELLKKELRKQDYI
jgi:hypothetical protein